MRHLAAYWTRLALATLGLILPGATVSAVPITLIVTWEAGTTEALVPEQARIELLPAGGREVDSAAKTLEVPVPGEATLDLPAESLWQLRATAARAWARELVFSVPDSPSSHVVALLPTGRLTGSLTLPDGTPEVQEVTVRFQAPPRGSGFDPARTTCPVTEGGSWQCELPHGVYDLRLGARGFAPEYFWGVSVSVTKALTLGAVELRPGASLSGTVILEPGVEPEGAQSPQVSVSLRPAATRPQGNYTDAERLPRLQRTVTANEWGHFQFTDLVPGEYFVTVRAPGFAESLVGPVSVFAPNESILEESILLRPPASFEVVVHPALAPSGDPWRLWLRPTPVPGRDLTARYGGQVGLDGSWKVSDIPEGSYYLTVFSANTEWVTEDVEVQAGAALHEIVVPVVTVEGKLNWSGEPRPLALWFVELGTQKRTRFEQDEDEFQGYLPYEGTWQVLLFDPHSRRRYFLEPVEVETSPSSGIAHVDIDVPDGSIRGRVIDGNGQGIPNIEVELGVWQQSRLPSTTRTGAHGDFQFELLAAQSYLVSVDIEEFALAAQRVHLQKGLEPPPVILQLEEETPLTLRISADGLPLPGTLIHIVPSDTGPKRASSGITGVAGEVELKVPTKARSLVALIFPPGYALRWISMAASSSRVEVPVERAGGTLTIRWSPQPELQVGARAVPPVLIRDGTAMPLGLFQGWARDRGVWNPEQGHISIPMLETGHYTVCAPANSEDLPVAVDVASGTESGCQSGFVLPSSELILALP